MTYFLAPTVVADDIHERVTCAKQGSVEGESEGRCASLTEPHTCIWQTAASCQGLATPIHCKWRLHLIALLKCGCIFLAANVGCM